MVYVALEWIFQLMEDFITSFIGYLDIIGSLNFVDIEYLILQFSEPCRTIHLSEDCDSYLADVRFPKFQSFIEIQILSLANTFHVFFFLQMVL